MSVIPLPNGGYAPGHSPADQKKKKKKLAPPTRQGLDNAPAYSPPKQAGPPDVSAPLVDATAQQRALDVLQQPGIEPTVPSTDYLATIKTPAYAPQPVDAQIDGIVWAYAKLNGGKHPSPAKLMMLLMTTPPSTTREQYLQLLNPASLAKSKSLMWTDPRVVEAEAMRPHVDDLSGDFDPSDELRLGFSTGYTDTSKTLGDWDSRAPDPLKAVRQMRSKDFIRESMDVDKTLYDKGIHDIVMSDVRYTKQQIGQRVLEWQSRIGAVTGLDLDTSTDEYDYKTDQAYRMFAAAPVITTFLLSKDPKEKREAARVLGIVSVDENGNPTNEVTEGLLFDLYGNDVGKVRAELQHLTDTLSTAFDQEKVAQLAYDLYQFGRPFGQSERARRMDYASRWPDMVPVEEAEKVAADTWSVGRALNIPFEIIPVVKKLHDDHDDSRGTWGVVLDAINTPLQGVEGAFAVLGGVVGAANQAVVSVYNLALLSDGYHSIDPETGDVVMKPELIGKIRKGTNYGKAQQSGPRGQEGRRLYHASS